MMTEYKKRKINRLSKKLCEIEKKISVALVSSEYDDIDADPDYIALQKEAAAVSDKIIALQCSIY